MPRPGRGPQTHANQDGTVIFKSSPNSAPTRSISTIASSASGIFRRWLPRRWLRFGFQSRKTEVAPVPRTSVVEDSLSASIAAALASVPFVSSLETGANRAGVDVPTYNLLLDLQHRDITPEDYDTLRRLDSSVAPRTLPLEKLQQLAPSFHIPAETAGSTHGTACRVRAVATRSTAPRATGLSSPVRRTRRTPRALPASDGECCSGSSAERVVREGQQPQSCSICLEHLAPGERARGLPCLHVFHAECIDHWFTKCSDVCPECSQRLE